MIKEINNASSFFKMFTLFLSLHFNVWELIGRFKLNVVIILFYVLLSII